MVKMTVGQLMEFLRNCDPDMEVRMAVQPNYPFEHRIANAIVRGKNDDEIRQIQQQLDSGALSGEQYLKLVETLESLEMSNVDYVYMVEGDQIGYISDYFWK